MAANKNCGVKSDSFVGPANKESAREKLANIMKRSIKRNSHSGEA